MLKTVRNIGCTVAIALTVMGIAPRANAESSHASIVVWAEGPDKDAARAQAMSALGGDFSVIDASDWQSALAQQGHHGPVGPALRDPKKRAHLLDQIRRAGKALHAAEVVVVLTSRTQHGRQGSLLVIDPASTAAPTETALPESQGDEKVSEKVQEEVTKAHAAPADSDTDASAKDGKDASAEPGSTGSTAGGEPGRDEGAKPAHPSSHHVGRNLFEVAVGVEGGIRHFDYNEGLVGNLRTYDLNGAPLVAAEGAIYPFVSAFSPSVPDIGIVLGYARAFALQSSQTDTGGTLTTQWSRYHVGAHARIRTGGEGTPIIGVTGAYGDEAFSVDGPSATGLPGVDYHYVQTSADLRVPMGHFALVADGGYLFVLSAGDVAARFPQSSVGGVEAKLGGALELTPGLEARLTASYRRFFYTMNPKVGDNYVAGGALDQFGGLQASIAYVY
jgi:hypothetical protein